jgi:hypothetical protein
MKRVIVAVTVASACALGLTVQAQEKTKTEVKGAAQTVTYSGCVQNGAETQTYILDKAVPVSRTVSERTGTSGVVTTTTTTYALVPGEKVELVKQVGHKVEVTGIMIPAGEKVEAKTKIEREHGKDTKITETSKGGILPQFRVTSIKQLAESCE